MVAQESGVEGAWLERTGRETGRTGKEGTGVIPAPSFLSLSGLGLPHPNTLPK